MGLIIEASIEVSIGCDFVEKSPPLNTLSYFPTKVTSLVIVVAQFEIPFQILTASRVVAMTDATLAKYNC